MQSFWTPKHGHVDCKEMTFINPFLGMVFYYFVAYAVENDLPVRVTSITGDAVGRMSTTHSSGRAIDLGIIGWNTKHLKALQRDMNKLYMNWGTAPVGKPPQVFVWGDEAHEDHVHLQVRRYIKLTK